MVCFFMGEFSVGRRFVVFFFMSMPSIFILLQSIGSSFGVLFFLGAMQFFWLPLVVEDFKFKHVGVLRLVSACIFSIVAPIIFLEANGEDFIKSFFVVGLFVLVDFFSRLGFKRGAFGFADFPAVFCLGFTVGEDVLGIWIAISGIMGLAQALSNGLRVGDSVAMIPLLYFSWQFCVML